MDIIAVPGAKAVFEKIIAQYNQDLQGLLDELRNGDPILRRLLEEIEQRDITIIPSESVRDFFQESSLAVCGFGCFPQLGYPRVIGISLKHLNRALRQSDRKKEFSKWIVGLSHEIGHFIFLSMESPCMYKLKTHPIWGFTYRSSVDCKYEQLRAYEEGFILLDRICGGIENWQPDKLFGYDNLLDFWRWILEMHFECRSGSSVCNYPLDIHLVAQRVEHFLTQPSPI